MADTDMKAVDINDVRPDRRSPARKMRNRTTVNRGMRSRLDSRPARVAMFIVAAICGTLAAALLSGCTTTSITLQPWTYQPSDTNE